MKAVVIIDYWDDTPGKQKEINLEDLHGNQIAAEEAQRSQTNAAPITQ